MGNKHGTSYRPVTVPPPRDEVAEALAKVDTPPAVPVEKSQPKPAGAMVKNISTQWLVQFSTGTRINAGEEKLLADDGWLAGQIEAGLLKKVD